MNTKPRLPAAGDCLTRDVLVRRAAEHPERAFILFENGESWSYAATLVKVRRLAAGLATQGIEPGELVLSWQGNGPMAVLSFLALNYLGAVYVPINTNYVGGLLAHVLANSGSRHMIADGRLISRLADINTGALQRVFIVGEERPALPALQLESAADLAATEATPPEHPIAPSDLQMVIYTSGTTGPSKGVMSSYVHCHTAATGFRNIGPGDRNLMQLPMFHVGGPYAVLWALYYGGSTVVIDSFSVTRFWETVRRYEVTTVGLLGAMTQFLLRQPPSADDTKHTLRSVIIAPFDESGIEFGERFGVPTFTEFNMTELSVPLWAGPSPTEPGTCGTPQGNVELKLIDDDGNEVAPGETGELIVRPDHPLKISQGYLNAPDATANSWRDGWFHTGDMFRRDDDDNYFFIDRLRDAIRRRGENISSFEVESAILQHPDVREAAAVPVPAAESEDEVLAAIALKPGGQLQPAELIEFLRDKLAYFMIPRYLRILDELPRTPTQKVEKHRLRDAGVTADTFDREAAGIKVEREKLTAR